VAPPPPVEPGPAPAVAAPPSAALPGPEAGKIYTAEDTTVTAPIVLTQNIPGIPPNLMALARPRGLLEVVIDELGRVIGMSMRGSIHPTYDAQVLMAARDWKYKPATFNGKPVKFRRLISINVQR
jgi:TonB family protein